MMGAGLQNGRGRASRGALPGMVPSGWVEVGEAAGHLGITRAVAMAWLRSGRLPGIIVFGGALHGAVLVRRVVLYGLMSPLGTG